MELGTALLPCPVGLIEAVAAHRDKLIAGEIDPMPTVDTTINIGTAATVTNVEGQGPWTEDEIVALAKRTNYDEVVFLMETLGGAGGEWVYDPPRIHATHDERFFRRNQLAAWSKLIGNMFDDREYWPITWKREGGSYKYCCDATIASWWKQGREGI